MAESIRARVADRQAASRQCKSSILQARHRGLDLRGARGVPPVIRKPSAANLRVCAACGVTASGLAPQGSVVSPGNEGLQWLQEDRCVQNNDCVPPSPDVARAATSPRVPDAWRPCVLDAPPRDACRIQPRPRRRRGRSGWCPSQGDALRASGTRRAGPCVACAGSRLWPVRPVIYALVPRGKDGVPLPAAAAFRGMSLASRERRPRTRRWRSAPVLPAAMRRERTERRWMDRG